MKQKFKLSFEGIEATLNSAKAKIKGFGNAVNSTFSGMKTSNLNNQLKNTEQYSKQSINSIMRSLKELRTELNKAGQYNKSNAVKEFYKNFMREQGKFMIDDRRDSINKSLQKIGDTEVSSKWVKSFDKAINTAEKKTSKISKMGNNIIVGLNKALTLTAIAYGMRKLMQGVGYVAEEYISLVESNNLFQVSMKAVADEYGNIDMASSTYYKRAIDFQNQMSEKLGANKKELQNYQAIYMNMFSGQGISNDISYRLSENLTKAGYDLASLYNKDIKTTMENLQSGISGQPEGLRKNFGIDISEGTLNGILDNLGIERSVDQLSYAEKEVARYIAILRQAGNAQGDFAKTIDSPANQLKMLKNQFAELAQVAGSFVVNWFGGLIAYVNGAIMAVKQVLIYFATLFGYDLDFGGATSSMQDTSDAIGGIGSGLSDASGKAKELKKELMGFDEINNIQKPTDSSGGGGGGGASGAGIDSKLLEALDDWDNKMESIQGKAQEIRDTILEWLGFDANGNLKEGLTNFEKIKDVVKAIGVAFGTWTVSKAITNLLSSLGILSKPDAFKLTFGFTLALTGIFAQYKGVEHLLDGDVDLFTILETLLGTAGGTFGIVNVLNATRAGKTIPLGKKIKIGTGIMLAIAGVQTYVDGMLGIKDGKITSADLLKSIGGALGVGVSMAIMGLSIPVSATVSLLLLGMTIQSIGEQTTLGQTTKLLRERLGIDKDGTLQMTVNYIGFTVKAFEFVGLENLVRKAIKNLVYAIADFVEGIPVIGEGMATAIRAGITATEESTSEHIARSVSGSINKAQGSIDTTAQESGMQTMLKLKQGIGSQQATLDETIKETQNNSLIKARNTVNPTAETSGMEAMLKLKQGISSKQTILDETVKKVQDSSLTNARPTVNSTAETSGMQAMLRYKQGITSQQGSAQTSAEGVARKVEQGLNTVDTTEAGRQAVNGVATGINNNKNNWNLLSAIKGLASNVVTKLKSSLGIHSPSTVMRDMVGKFIPLGVAEGIDSEAGSVYASIRRLNEGIKVNAQDFSIDTNQYVDYGTIEGTVQTQSNVSISSNIIQGMAYALSKAMGDTNINVNIEAKTEEGVIVKKATEGIKDFVNQTGELPFPIPV